MTGTGLSEEDLLVELLNTLHLPDGDDVLADDRRTAWLARATGAPAAERTTEHPVEPAAAAVRRLAAVREGIRASIRLDDPSAADPSPRQREAREHAQAVLAAAPLTLDLATGALSYAADDPTDIVLGLAVTAFLRARGRSSWTRLRTCANPACQWAFFDRTRNGTRRWCQMSGCGNQAKNRAYRARKTSGGARSPNRAGSAGGSPP